MEYFFQYLSVYRYTDWIKMPSTYVIRCITHVKIILHQRFERAASSFLRNIFLYLMQNEPYNTCTIKIKLWNSVSASVTASRDVYWGHIATGQGRERRYDGVQFMLK